MKTERKMLISIALIFIMLLNCIMPLFSVYATTADEIVLNTNLYNAIKAELTEQAVVFKADDRAHTIEISADVIATITRLDLNSYGISDLTGLEKFTALNHLELSGNNLTKNSNLAAIASLPLNYLDLSTNSIEDISDISALISTIKAASGTVILTNQTVTVTKIVEATTDGVTTVEFPKILAEAGYIKDVWDTISDPSNKIKSRTFGAGNTLSSMEVYTDEPGYLAYNVYIYDDPTEAASADNLNEAATNPLKESRFNVFVVVHSSEQTGIYLPDTNLYNEVKRQLTAGMLANGNLTSAGNTTNTDIASYPYKVDFDGNILYDECTYKVIDSKIVLYVDREAKYILNADEGNVYKCASVTATSATEGEFYTKTFVSAIVEDVEPATGTITYKSGYRVAINGENETLYDVAYDDAHILVIDNKDLMNKITSLILNNKQIRDLTGLEWFVGLKSSLDVSQNHLSDIDPLYSLQGNKDTYQTKLQQKYNYVLNSRPVAEGGNLKDNMGETTKAKSAADKNKEDILKTVTNAITKIAEGAKIKEYTGEVDESGDPVRNENYATELDNALKATEEVLKLIYDHTNTNADGSIERVKGYDTLLGENLDKSVAYLKKSYSNLEALYDVYSNEYKLLTLLSDEMNYMDFPEYIVYKEKVETETGKKALISGEISVLTNLESKDAFTYFEEEMLEVAFSSDFTVDSFDLDERENTLAKGFAEYQETYGTVNTDWLDIFREIALYAEMANYCLIERMNDTTTSGICYCEEYLKTRIKEFKDDGVDTQLEEKILGYVENMENFCNGYIANPTTYSTGNDLLDVYVKYYCKELIYTGATVNPHTCEGNYEKVTDLSHDDTEYTLADILALPKIREIIDAEAEVDTNGDGTPDSTEPTYPDAERNIRHILNNLSYDLVKEIFMYEHITTAKNRSEADKLYLYEEAVTLSNRLLSSNVSRYVYLPKLKALDISKNADLSGIDRLDEFTSLRELHASSNYIGDISTVDWNAITYLRKVSLADNFITDITPLQNLKYLTELDVSKNLLSGAFNFSFVASQDYLKELNLANNQLDDITNILIWLDSTVGANYGNYLAREDTLNINLNNQTLNMEVDGMVYLPENPETINIEVPKIITQLASIDTERTTYGYESLTGRLESEGTYVTLNTRTIGDKTAKVTVEADNGYTTCVGLGTTLNVKYKVADRTVSSVTVAPDAVEMGVGEEQTFTATVVGENLEDTTVSWTVEGSTSPTSSTTIDENGVLKIGDDETATSLTVRATSNFDNSKSGTATVTIVKREVTEFTIDPVTTTIIKGESADFTVTINGNYLRTEDKEIDWNVTADTGAISANTTATINNNVLTLAVGADETANTITITATSKRDNTKVATATVTLVSREVKEITINPTTSRNEVGTAQEFTAELKGAYLNDAKIVWSVEGASDVNTTITEKTFTDVASINDDQTSTSVAELKIGADETAEKLTVKATASYKGEKSATAEVTVFARKVNEVVVNPNTSRLEVGSTQKFEAQVNGEDLEDTDKGVDWSVSGNKSTDTKIAADGTLTIAAGETATELTITATSKLDNTKSASARVEVYARKITTFALTPETTETLKGNEVQFTVNVDGENLEATDKTVKWEVLAPEGSTKSVNAGTTIDANGKLTVSKDEENSELVVKVTSNFDNTKVATAKVTLKNPQPQIGLGYTVDSESILNVETKMPVDAFKAKLAKDYKVVVKTDGENKAEVTEGNVKTGMWAYIYAKDDTEMSTPLKDENGDLLVFQIIVKGDVNGDGIANGLDSNAIKAHINEVKTLTDAQFKAADINNDGKVDIRDSKLLLYHIAEVKGYTFDYVAPSN